MRLLTRAHPGQDLGKKFIRFHFCSKSPKKHGPVPESGQGRLKYDLAVLQCCEKLPGVIREKRKIVHADNDGTGIGKMLQKGLMAFCGCDFTPMA